MDLLISWSLFALTAYQWAIIACIIISFFPEFQHNDFAKILSRIADPFLAIFRKFIPPIGGWDLSTLIALIVLRIAIQGLLLW
jgi:YggT family protein